MLIEYPGVVNVGIPIIPDIEPPAPMIGKTSAPIRGANPKPLVDPIETIKPPLGKAFWLGSSSETTGVPSVDVIPVRNQIIEIDETNTTVTVSADDYETTSGIGYTAATSYAS